MNYGGYQRSRQGLYHFLKIDGILLMPLNFLGSGGPSKHPITLHAWRGPFDHWTKVQSGLASVFYKNGKGVSRATPGHRRGGHRNPFSVFVKMYAN